MDRERKKDGTIFPSFFFLSENAPGLAGGAEKLYPAEILRKYRNEYAASGPIQVMHSGARKILRGIRTIILLLPGKLRGIFLGSCLVETELRDGGPNLRAVIFIKEIEIRKTVDFQEAFECRLILV